MTTGLSIAVLLTTRLALAPTPDPVDAPAPAPPAGSAAPPAADAPAPAPTAGSAAPPAADAPAPAPPAGSAAPPAADARPDAPAYLVEHQPGQGVRVSSDDGRFSMQTWLRGQVRDTVVHDAAGMPPLGQTVELRRVGLFFAGSVFSPHTRYFAQFVFAPRDLGLQEGHLTQSPIFDLFFSFEHLRDLSVRVGQYKPFFSRQFIAGWGDLQLVDRSIVQDEFHLDRDIGIDLYSNDLGGIDRLRYAVGVHAGQGRNSIAARAFRMSYVARFEVLPLGRFDDYVEADLEHHPTPKLALGAAYAYGDHTPRDRGVIGAVPEDGGATNTHSIAADSIFKIRGFSASAELFWRHGTRVPGSAVDDMGDPFPVTAPRNGLGWFAQAGYVLPRTPVGLAVRGGEILGQGQTSLVSTSELGGGPSWYVHGQALKLQADYFHSWAGTDIQHGVDQLRLQLQVAI